MERRGVHTCAERSFLSAIFRESMRCPSTRSKSLTSLGMARETERST